MDIVNRIITTESGIFIVTSAELSSKVAVKIAASSNYLIHVTRDQDPKRVIEQALTAAGIPPQLTLAAGLGKLSDSLLGPIVLLVEAVEKYDSADLMYELKAAREELNSSSHHGLRIAFFGTNPQLLRLLCRHHAAAFFCAEYLDTSVESADV